MQKENTKYPKDGMKVWVVDTDAKGNPKAYDLLWYDGRWFRNLYDKGLVCTSRWEAEQKVKELRKKNKESSKYA